METGSSSRTWPSCWHSPWARKLAGVVGALIALPLAAVYPSIERIWLRERLPETTVAEHGAIERRRAG